MELQEVLALEPKEAYSLLLVCKDEYRIPKDLFPKIRFGFNLKFDYHNFLHENFSTKGKTGHIFIEGHWHELSEFYSEVEKRETATKQLLIRYILPKSILRSR